MSYSQRYCVVYFKSPQKDGSEFRMDGWPIHITLADVFAVDLDKSSIVKKFEDLCSESIPVPVTVKSESNLGETPVLLLSESPGLAGLHTKVVSLLESSGAIFNSPEFTRAGFIGPSDFMALLRFNSASRGANLFQ